MARAFLFPGQGSQYVGMGRDLHAAFAEARAVFAEIDESLGQKLSALMFNGPEDELNLTENTQPAMMAVSMAVVRVLQQQGGIELAAAARFAAGHSLGEYSALTAAQSLTLADSARLLKLRGRAMQRAVPTGAGSMAAILGLSFADVEQLAAQAADGEICAAANDNSAGQVVVSGHRGAVARAVELAAKRGAKRAVMLPVSAPFHCALMAPAAQAMQEALAAAAIRPPAVPVVANVTARATGDPDEIRRLLVEQVTGMVRWRESVLWMRAQGADEMIELGAGKVLRGLVRRIDCDIDCAGAATPQEVEALITRLTG